MYNNQYCIILFSLPVIFIPTLEMGSIYEQVFKLSEYNFILKVTIHS